MFALLLCYDYRHWALALAFNARLLYTAKHKLFLYSYQTLSTSVLGVFFGYWNLLYFLGAMNSSICIYIHYQNRSRVWEREWKKNRKTVAMTCTRAWIYYLSFGECFEKLDVYTWWWALTSGQTNWTFSNVDIFATKWGWTGYEYAVFDSLMTKIRLNPLFAI